MNNLFRQPQRYPAYAPINTLSTCSGTRSPSMSGLSVALDRFQWIVPTRNPNAHVVNDITKRLTHNFKNTTGILFRISILPIPVYAMSVGRSTVGVVMNYICLRQTLHVRNSAPSAVINGTTNSPLGASNVKSVAYEIARHTSALRSCNTPQMIAHTKSKNNHIPPLVFAIPGSKTSAAGTAVSEVVSTTSLPQLPQKLVPGLIVSPHCVQKIVGLPILVYASQPFEVLEAF